MNMAAESNFLLGMAESSRQRDVASRGALSDAQQRAQLLHLKHPSGLHLASSGFDLIAEIKKRSPAEGYLDNSQTSMEVQATAYVRGGAAVLSVLM